jgi:hypothetical protein
MTKGRHFQTSGLTNVKNLPFSGAETARSSSPASVFQHMLKSFSGAFIRPVYYMAPAVSKFNTYNNFNFKELPVRAAASAHWSGPFMAAR